METNFLAIFSLSLTSSNTFGLLFRAFLNLSFSKPGPSTTASNFPKDADNSSIFSSGVFPRKPDLSEHSCMSTSWNRSREYTVYPARLAEHTTLRVLLPMTRTFIYSLPLFLLFSGLFQFLHPGISFSEGLHRMLFVVCQERLKELRLQNEAGCPQRRS